MLVKGNVVLCLTKYDAMQMYGAVELQRHSFLSSALDEGE